MASKELIREVDDSIDFSIACMKDIESILNKKSATIGSMQDWSTAYANYASALKNLVEVLSKLEN